MTMLLAGDALIFLGGAVAGFLVGWSACYAACRGVLRTHGIRHRDGSPY